MMRSGHRIRHYGLFAGAARAHNIDGALWFVENPGNAVARIGVEGRIREFPLPEPDRYPNAIGVGPDGALFGGSARAASAA
jgi:virginiamycin B lyase